MAALFPMILTSCKNKPEVDKSNPFFSEFNTPFGVPPFEKIMAKHYMPAFEAGMAEGRKKIDKIIKNEEEPTFDNTVVAYDQSSDLLTKVSNVFFAQAEANTNDSIQAIEVEISPKLAEYYER